MSLQDVLWLLIGGVLGVGASLIVGFLPDLLRAIRARALVRERRIDE